jgi:hypothetical protein
MTLNIKNEEAHRLAAELAKITGESLTAAVTTAIRERLDRLRVRLKTFSRITKLSQHEADGREFQEGKGVGG